MLERIRTRDLLLEYDRAIMPPHPREAGLSNIYSWGSTPLDNLNGEDPPIPLQQDISIIYPWENTSLSIFSHQLFLVAIVNGFMGTEREFLDRFVNYVSDKQIIFDNLKVFDLMIIYPYFISSWFKQIKILRINASEESKEIIRNLLHKVVILAVHYEGINIIRIIALDNIVFSLK